MRVRIVTVVVILVFVAGAAIWYSPRHHSTPANQSMAVPRSPVEVLPTSHPIPNRRGQGYRSSDACQSCHPQQHASWHGSFHRTMTQWAEASTVLGDFDNVTLNTADQFATLTKRGDEYWVNTVDPEWEKATFEAWADARGTVATDPFDTEAAPPRVDAKVVMTTGSHHFQAYWIQGSQGRELWQFPWRYHLAERRWVHRKDVFLAPPEWRPGMWSRVWNSRCIYCHSTGPYPGQDANTGVMDNTQVVELGIACEACHGPGNRHIQFHQDNGQRGLLDTSDPIVNPAKLAHDRSAQICGACHSHFQHHDKMLAVEGPKFRPGRNLFQYGGPHRPTDESGVMARYWADGTNRSGGREFSGMSVSACYSSGEISCTHCHSMHNSHPNDQLSDVGRTTESCLQCHETLRSAQALADHTHHPADSVGSDCYNCHMPHTNYALFKAIRSHKIDSPAVRPFRSNSRPNACNLCHLDQTLAWTAEHLQAWHQIASPALNEQEKTIAAGILWSWKGDAGQRVITAWHLGNFPHHFPSAQWTIPTLAQLMKDPYAAVRWVAHQALQRQLDVEFAYDFDAAAEIRDPHVDVMLTEWLATRDRSSPGSTAEQARLVQTADGEPDVDRLQQLLEQRDNRLMAGVE